MTASYRPFLLCGRASQLAACAPDLARKGLRIGMMNKFMSDVEQNAEQIYYKCKEIIKKLQMLKYVCFVV